jgi:microcompartment protein CcmL/EutN
MQLTLAFVETKGFVGAVEAADAMTKTASVHIVKYTKIGDGYVTVLIEGELSDCQAAVESGSAAASRIGELISSGIIPRPMDDLSLFRNKMTKKKKEKAPTKAIKEKAAAKSPDITGLIKKATDGITLEELEKITKKSKDKIRQIIKKLMDEDKVEKIHKKHYWIT